MKYSSYLIYPSSISPLPESILFQYSSSGVYIINIVGSSTASGLVIHPDYAVLHVTHDCISFPHLSSLLGSCFDICTLSIRLYIEPCAFVITEIPACVPFLAVLGDTHHIPGSLKYAFNFLSSCLPTVLTSYANPGDALLIGRLLNLPPASILLYPPSLIVKNTLGTSSGLDLEPSSSRTKYVALCSTLSRFQLPRSALIRYILRYPDILQLFYLFPFQRTPAAFKRILSRFSFLYVPTNGSQISPQVFAGLFMGLNIISDCHFQLSLHPLTRGLLPACFQSSPSTLHSLPSLLHERFVRPVLPTDNYVETTLLDNLRSSSLRIPFHPLLLGPHPLDAGLDAFFASCDDLIQLRKSTLFPAQPDPQQFAQLHPYLFFFACCRGLMPLTVLESSPAYF